MVSSNFYYIFLVILPYFTCSQIIPLSYDLLLKLPITEYNGFTGSMVAHIHVTRLTRNITLDSVGLHQFRNVTLIRATSDDNLILDEEPQLSSVNINRDSVDFRFGSALYPGQYLLTIGEYSGRIRRNQSNGLFERKSLTSTLYTTHLQPNYARTLFPCIDDPSVKSFYRLSIVHPTNTVAQSNTIATDVHVESADWQRTIFASTPRLPAYLLAFSVTSDNTIQLSRQTSFGVTLRSNGIDRTSVLRVLEAATSSFEVLAQLIDVPLPLNKIDFVLVSQYDGGMENWGHIIISQDLATNGDEAHLIYLISHEIAHHWIGNRVTIDNWKYICLQEDLADYFAVKTVEALLQDQPSKIERFRLSQYVEIQLVEDFLSPNHSLVMPENVTQDIINRHCYLKGVVMLNTLESVVGENYMLAAIKSLVNTHETFNLTTFMSYFDEIRVEQNVSLADIYQYWYTKGGYPMILVENTGPSSRLRQLSKPLWPLKMTSTLNIPQFVFTESLIFPSESSTSPLLVNLNFTSFMRVNYDNVTWNSIFRYMNDSPLLFSPLGRAQLISDFCYFYANDQVENGDSIKQSVIDMIYTNPEYYELCDWNLYWCLSSTQQSIYDQFVQSVAFHLTQSTFDADSAFGCKNGMAAKKLNQFCETIFGRKCL